MKRHFFAGRRGALAPVLSLAFALALAPAFVCCSPAGGGLTSKERALVGSSSDLGLMRVLQSDDPSDLEVLRKVSKPLSDKALKSKELEILCERMLLTVNDPDHQGVGIAAPQVGVSRRLVAVMRYDKEGTPWEFFANPRIVRYGENTAPGAEGCLSVPDRRGIVDRSQEIDLSYRTVEGRDTLETVFGYTAVIFQHEIDHLDGVLYSDKATVLGNESFQTRLLDDGSKVTWIGDNAKPREMPVRLFPDATPEMLEGFGLGDGLRSSVSVFLLEKDGRKILFDAGDGTEDSRLFPVLEELGVRPEDVGDVFITHLHGDHIGGLLSDSGPTFPAAEVWIAKEEMEGWMAMPSERNAQQRTLASAYEGRIKLFDAGDPLPCGVQALQAFGHTPGHTVYRSANLLVVGDILHGLELQLLNPDVCALFDQDKPLAVESRKMVLKTAAEEGFLLAGMHFPAPAFFKL